MDREALQVLIEAVNKAGALDKWIVLLSVAAVICSAVFPFLVNLTNKRHERKMKIKELNYQYKLEFCSKLYSLLFKMGKETLTQQEDEHLQELLTFSAILCTYEIFDKATNIYNMKKHNDLVAYCKEHETLLELFKKEFTV